MSASVRPQAHFQAVRVRHHQGQRLSGSDARTEDAQSNAMRQLHIRTLHDAWGVALGMDVYLDSGADFIVNAGLAYDRLGREIVLAQARSAPPLTAEHGDGVYQLVAALSDASEPLLRWNAADATRLGLEVPLVAVTIAHGILDTGSFNFNVRPYAQPLTRPHIAYGLSPREQRWRIWRKGGGEHELGFGIRVDTTAAGFVGTPFYVASLQMSANSLFVGPANATQVQMYVFGSLANATRTGFTFRVVIAGLAPRTVPAGAKPPPSTQDVFKRFVAGNLPFQVAWTGIEPIEACAPSGLSDQ
jgi:hypothetical protein